MIMTFYDAVLGIEIPDEMGVYYDSDELSSNAEMYLDKIRRLAKSMDVEYEYFCGASQLCIVEENADSVLKIPFDGIVKEWQDDEDEDLWHKEFKYFETNYTFKTEELYTYAEEEGVEDFFAGIKCFGHTFNHQPIWVQTYVEPLNNQCISKHPSKDSIERAKNIKSPFDKSWVAVFLDIYGEKRFNDLIKFIKKFDINDMHWGNYGYTRDGIPMILDYAGFNEDC